MALRLTTENLPAAYEYLRACEPFCRWGLPEADEVAFRVSRHKDRFGHMRGDAGSPGAEIAVSEACVGSSARLIEVVGHEMIHLHQHMRKTETSGAQHNAEFKRLARQVCAEHVFDFKAFV
jgi:hypothetical protein